MSNCDLLYVRRMTESESDKDDDEHDIWDDRKLNDAYDKALSIANAEVAKRLAMSTNTQHNEDNTKFKKPMPIPSSGKSQKIGRTKWKAGMHCRAVYEEDGIEYEAFLMRILNDKECLVRFIGYENTEIVALNSLKSSLGKRERTRQLEDALVDNLADGVSNHSDNVEEMVCGDRPQSVASSVSVKKKKSKKSKPKQMTFDLPELPPMAIPNFAHLRNIGAMDMPIPPPPPMALSRAEIDSEDQAVSSMLLSWYMSGYYTGLYQGMKRARDARKK